ncbi:MAG: endonuclease/exonuclease/phosphatase family protein [Saprospiraceae bacterium]|nr:endonuclease/exonuclease/phosphatase family protein [Saprospiraceae bacterium]
MSWLSRAVLVINVLLCLATLFAYAAPHVDPQQYWVFAFFGLIYPVLILLLLVSATYWLFIDIRWALLSILTIAVGYQSIFNYFSFHSGAVISGANDISVVSFNIGNALEAYDRRSELKANKLQKMKEFLRRFQDEDIICLQEVGAYASDLLRNNFGDYHVHKFNKGAVILSKHKITKKGQIEFGTRTNSCLWADIAIGEDTVRIYSIHLQSNKITKDANEVLTKGSLKEDKTWDGIFGILKKYRYHHKARSIQARTVREHIDLSPYPVLICGDFNDVPMSFTYRHLQSGLTDAYKEKGTGIGSTFNGKIPFLRIDYILVSPSLRVNKFNVIRENFSDHYPVAALLSLGKT